MTAQLPSTVTSTDAGVLSPFIASAEPSGQTMAVSLEQFTSKEFQFVNILTLHCMSKSFYRP